MAGALVARFVCMAGTHAPDRDAAWYAWAAARFHAGETARALVSVFPPLHPLAAALLGPLGTGGEGWWRSLQVVGLLADLATLRLLFGLLAERAGRRAALFAGIAFAFGMLPGWTVADGMSGPLFRLFAAATLVFRVRGSSLGAGLSAGLAAVTRPEGLVLAPLAIQPGRGRLRALAALGLALLPRALYLHLRAGATGEFLLFPKGATMASLSALAEGGAGDAAWHWLREAGRFLLQGFDGLGYFPYLLLPFGATRILRGAKGPGAPFRLPLALVLAALLVVPFFFGNRRFWTPWLPILLIPPALAFARIPKSRRTLAWSLFLLALLPHSLRLFRPRRAILAALPEIATVLGDAPFATDLPRLHLFAGRRPPPPLAILPADLMRAAALPSTRWVVSLRRRRSLDAARLLELGYRPWIPTSSPQDPVLRASLERLSIWRR